MLEDKVVLAGGIAPDTKRESITSNDAQVPAELDMLKSRAMSRR
jgi:hypothetical protein